MGVCDRLQRLAGALPENGSVILTRADLLELADADDGKNAGTDLQADFTVARVAEIFERKPQTVRDWIKTGKLRGYPFNGREYRVTKGAVEEFMEEQRNGQSPPGVAAQTDVSDLGAWRHI